MSVTAIGIICAAVIAAVALFFIVRAKRGKVQGNYQIYIGNLAYRVNEPQVKEHFSQYGEITQLKIVRDSRTRRSKGFGFVTYGDAAEAQRALQANGETFKGRVLVVRIAKERE